MSPCVPTFRVLMLSAALVLMSFCGRTYSLGGYSSARARQGAIKSFTQWGRYAPPARNLVLETVDAQPEGDLERLFPDGETPADGSVCMGKRCTANEHCCRGAVCVDTEGLVGTCMPIYGSKQGEPCEKNDDCEAGLACLESNEGEVVFRTCQRDLSTYHRKQFNEECGTSNECMVEKGLCCQLVRRHRQAARKSCQFFKDERVCIGHLDASLARPAILEQQKKAAAVKTMLGRKK